MKQVQFILVSCLFFCLMACSSQKEDDTPPSNLGNSSGIEGSFHYDCEKYVYSGSDPLSGKLNFEEKINESGTLTIAMTTNGGLSFEEAVSDNQDFNYIADSFHEADDIIYFNIPIDQKVGKGLKLDGAPLAWVDIDGEKVGFAGEFNKIEETFRMQYAIKRFYENAEGDTISETRFLKKLSNS